MAHDAPGDEVVLSGSALTMMERLLEQGAPLYGRATARPRLAPLDFRAAAAFADNTDPVELLRRWAVLGGRTGAPQQVGSWWSRKGDVEIDIVGVRRHRYMLVGSCKWRREADTDVLGELLGQQHALGPTAKNAKLLVFARESFTEQLRGRADEENVRLLTAADLFSD